MHYNIDDFLGVPGYAVKHIGWEIQTDPDSFFPFQDQYDKRPSKGQVSRWPRGHTTANRAARA